MHDEPTSGATEGVLAQDEECRVTHVSPAIARLMGRTGSDALGQDLRVLLGSPAGDELAAASERAREDGPMEVHTRLGGRHLRARVEALHGGSWIRFTEVPPTDRQAPSDSHLAQIWDHAPVGFAFLDRDLRFRRVNRAYAEGAGLPPEALLGRPHFELFPEPTHEAIFRRVAATGMPYRAYARPYDHPRDDAEPVTYWDWTLVPVRDERGEVEGLLLSMMEVTERLRSMEDLQRSRELLAASENRFRTMYREAPIGIELYDGHGRLVDANRAVLEIFGLEDVAGIRGFELFRDPAIPAAVREAVQRGEAAQAVMRYDFDEPRPQNPAPSSRTGVAWLDTHVIPADLCLDDEHGGYFVLLLDVTAQKSAEEGLRATLADKEVLLKEIHHRVKNNLQVVSSLLQLQSRHVEHTSDREILRASRDRIHVMAAIHEALYAAGDLARIDLQRYLDQVVRGLVGSYAPSGAVRTSVDMGGFTLGVDAAIPLGLAVNELVTNALQHGFPGDRRGEVTVTLRAAEAGWFLLTVRDDGVGLPEDFDQGAEAALGLLLVRSLCRQLGAVLEIDGDGVTEFRVRLPSRHLAPREETP